MAILVELDMRLLVGFVTTRLLNDTPNMDMQYSFSYIKKGVKRQKPHLRGSLDVGSLPRFTHLYSCACDLHFDPLCMLPAPLSTQARNRLVHF